jgi:sulfur-oxidizing protein SoxX
MKTTTSKTLALSAVLGAAAVALSGCASPKMDSAPTAAQLDAQAKAMMMASFRDEGIAKVDRLRQDSGQAACSSDKVPADSVTKMIEAQALASIKWPEGGRYLGDWKSGEKIAQGGRGMTWTDKSTDPKANGGNCYNCHQIDKAEISYGTIGPSLWNYGKLRGVKKIDDPASAPVIQYTWGKLWNSKAYSACSNMPRFGHKQLLNEDQIRDIMALLLDPASPVNQ